MSAEPPFSGDAAGEGLVLGSFEDMCAFSSRTGLICPMCETLNPAQTGMAGVKACENCWSFFQWQARDFPNMGRVWFTYRRVEPQG